MEKAYAATLRIHPLYHSRVVAGSFDRYYWEPLDPIKWPTIEWLDGKIDHRSKDSYMNLFLHAGVNLKIFIGETDTWFSFNTHHACSDGLGVVAFFKSLLLAYVNNCPPELMEKTNPDHLKHRGRFGLSKWQWLKLCSKHRIDRELSKKFISTQPARLFPINKLKVTHSGLTHTTQTIQIESKVNSSAMTVRISPEGNASILSVAKRHDLKLNDWLVACLFISLARWRRDIDPDSDSDMIRIGVPVNRRTRRTLSMPSCNMSSTFFLTCEQGKIHGGDEFFSYIKSYIEELRRKDTSLSLYLTLTLSNIIPWVLKRQAPKPQYSATIFLTNLGKLRGRIKMKDGQISNWQDYGFSEVITIPPMRPNAPAAISLSLRRNTIVMSLRYDDTEISAALAETLLRYFASEIGAGNHFVIRPFPEICHTPLSPST